MQIDTAFIQDEIDLNRRLIKQAKNGIAKGHDMSAHKAHCESKNEALAWVIAELKSGKRDI